MAENVEEKPKRRRKRRGEADEANVEEQQETGLTEGKGRATPGRRSRSTQEASSQGNFITRPFRGVIGYLVGVNDELKKVTWPTREELRSLTVMTIIVTIMASIALGFVAFVYTELFVFGLTQGNEWIFIAVGLAVVAIAFAAVRYNASSSNTPY